MPAPSSPRTLLAALVCLLLASSCVDSTAPAGSGLTGDAACLPPELAGHLASVEARGSGEPTLSRIENAAAMEAVGADRGGSFSAVDGDYLVETDALRVVIQQPSRQHFVGNYGGTPIDADIRRPDGVWHDVMGEMALMVGLGYTIDAQNIQVLRQDDGVLVVAATGPLRLLDYVNLPAMVDVIVSGLVPGSGDLDLNVPWSLDGESPLEAAMFYVFKAGERSFEMHTAICNPTEDVVLTTSTDFIDSGGTVSPFNSELIIDGEPGFGFNVDLDSLDDTAGLTGFLGETSGYALRIRDRPAAFFGFSGIGMLAHGAHTVVPFLADAILGFDHGEPPPGYFRLRPGGSVAVSRDVFVFDTMATLREEIYAADGIADTGSVEGTVRWGEQPGAGAKVAAIDTGGRLETMFTAGADGRFAGTLRAGSYELVSSLPGAFAGERAALDVVSGETAVVDLANPAPARLAFAVAGTDPELGSGIVPLPAKVTLICQGPCPEPRTRLFTDSLYDGFPEGVQLQAYVDHEGKVSVMAKRGRLRANELMVPAGSYELVVSRGMEFSIHRQPLHLAPGEASTVTAWLERVVDTSGYVSADLHVHTVNSQDAPAPLLDRVLTFAGEGVDVLVATDHDFLTDLGPVLRDLGMGAYLHSIVGEELTFTDIGHFNGYPLEPDPTVRQGGALDGSGGRGPTLSPEQMFNGLKDLGAVEDPVVQVNHGRSLLFGYFAAIGLDSGTLETETAPEFFRMDPASVTAAAGDTGLFSDRFDAFEVYNDYAEIAAGLNDLFAFLNLGLRRTGVAVSDTHDWYGSEAGAPRSFVAMPAGMDTAAAVDDEAFTRAIQAGRLAGSNGPFVTLAARDAGGGSGVGLGETLASGGEVELTVTVRMPEWVQIDTVEIFSNTPNTYSRAGDPVTAYPTPRFQRRVTDAEFTVAGGERVLTWTRTATVDRDAWFVAVARDDAGHGENFPMFPVLAHRDELPFGFTNALFVDRDGNGRYDAPGPQGEPRGGAGTIPALAPPPAGNRAAVEATIVETLQRLEH